MKLADKPVYPVLEIAGLGRISEVNAMGITYREALVLALVSNSRMIRDHSKKNAEQILVQADAIIKQMEEK